MHDKNTSHVGAIFWERHIIKSVPKKIHAVIFFLKKLKKNIFFLNSKIIIVHQMVMLWHKK